MGNEERQFWLRLTNGMDAFEYSSKRINPLFDLMGWGRKVLGKVFSERPERAISKDGFIRDYPFFETSLNSRGNAYLLYRMIEIRSTAILKSASFLHRFEKFSQSMAGFLRRFLRSTKGSTYTHLLNLDRHFLDFLRLTVGISRVEEANARKLQEILDHEIQNFG